MKVTRGLWLDREGGHALFLVLVLGSAALLVLGGILSWAHSSTQLTARNNEYLRAMAAAEAATEKIVAQVGNDYQNFGLTLVNASLDTYRRSIPNATEYDGWRNYLFTHQKGTPRLTTHTCRPLSPPS